MTTCSQKSSLERRSKEKDHVRIQWIQETQDTVKEREGDEIHDLDHGRNHQKEEAGIDTEAHPRVIVIIDPRVDVVIVAREEEADPTVAQIKAHSWK